MSAREILIGWALGALLGVRHALEPDHLAAVSTLVAESGSSRRGALLGALWGLGHSIALLLVAALLVSLQTAMPARVGDALEFLVAVMLMVLGARAIRSALREGRGGSRSAHAHGRRVHNHPGAADHVHVAAWAFAPRPLAIGLVHGLAGSGALTALVMAELPGASARLLYIACFGIGSMIGMALLSGLLALPILWLGGVDPPRARFNGLRRQLTLATGATSLGLGLWWGYPFLQDWF